MPRQFRVDIIESEAGWGSKVVDSKYFDTEIEARSWADIYNRKYNPPGATPSWYMIAVYEGD